jgi:hypothetical protein
LEAVGATACVRPYNGASQFGALGQQLADQIAVLEQTLSQVYVEEMGLSNFHDVEVSNQMVFNEAPRVKRSAKVRAFCVCEPHNR